MGSRERDLLQAVARFLRDYCGEDALHRWQDKLSDAEREWLAPAPVPLHEARRRFAEALRTIWQVLSQAVTTALRACFEALETLCAVFSGLKTELFGRGAS